MERNTYRQHLKEDCETCEDFAREDERVKVGNFMYANLNKLFDEKLGDYENNRNLIKQHDNWLFALTLAVIGLYVLVGYIIIK
jgi:hypothetical protein